MAMTNIAQITPRRVTVGLDTHLDQHAASVKDELGRELGSSLFPANTRGYKEMLAYARGFGEVEAFGVEGTGSYGAGLNRFLACAGEAVVEVGRPKRQDRRRHGKSDPADASAAARAVQSGDATAIPKAADATVEMIRVLRVAKRTAMKSRTQAGNALRAVLVTAPAGLREDLQGLKLKPLTARAILFRPGAVVDPMAATKMTLPWQGAGVHSTRRSTSSKSSSPA